MIKAKVIKPFYYAKDKELYLDEDRYNELKELGLVEEVKPRNIRKENAELLSKKQSKIEKAINDETRVLPD